MNPTLQSPLIFPRVTVAGQPLEVKLSLLAEFVLSGLGLDLANAVSVLRANDLRKYAMLLKLFTAMVAHNFAERGQDYPSPEQWALQIDKQPDKAEQLTGIYNAVYAVIVKKLEEQAEKNAPKPVTQMPAPDPTPVQ